MLLTALLLSFTAGTALAQSDADALARRMQGLQVELTNRLAAIEQSIRFVMDLTERIQRDQRESAEEIQGLVNEIRFQLAELRSQLPSGAIGTGSGFAEGPGPATGEGSLGVIRVPADASDAQQSDAEILAPVDPQPEQITALLDAIGGLDGNGGAATEEVSADALFDQARELLRDGFLNDASDQFKLFVQSHPDDPRIPDAYYWIGEAHFAMNRFRAAAEAHYKVVQEYSQSQRAPDSLLRLGMIFRRQGSDENACKALRSLGDVYPDADERLKARAEKEARDAGCEV